MKSLERLTRKWKLYRTARKLKKERTCAITCRSTEELTVFVEACKLTGHTIESTHDKEAFTLLLVSRSGKGANKKEIFEVANRVGQAWCVLERCHELNRHHSHKSTLWLEVAKFAAWEEKMKEKKGEGVNPHPSH